MFDGAQLAQAIAAHPGDTDAALTAYEEALFPRSDAFYAAAHAMLDLVLGDRTPFDFIDLLRDGPQDRS
ncbi:hypothetical protein [Actinacidiphila polyblastidii]|uniref:hypothetical protein n=1 Tax=Actinacidiphila polyblastidii TaxID=3110430 RepID=UPI0039BD72BD